MTNGPDEGVGPAEGVGKEDGGDWVFHSGPVAY